MASTAMYTAHLNLGDMFMTGLVATELSVPRVDIDGVWDRKRSSTPYCALEHLVSSNMTQIRKARSAYTEDF